MHRGIAVVEVQLEKWEVTKYMLLLYIQRSYPLCLHGEDPQRVTGREERMVRHVPRKRADLSHGVVRKR